MFRYPVTLPLVALCVASAAVAGETGAIRGRVEDTDGLEVPKARVVLSGADLAGERVVMSGADGTFRLDDLAPGEYDLTVWWNDRPSVTARVTVALERNTFLPVTIDLSAEVDEVDVILVKPVIDATSSTVDQTLSTDLIQNLPVGRTYRDAVATLPGVSARVDPHKGGAGGAPTVRGEGEFGNNFLVDGVSTRDPASKGAGSPINFDAIQDIQVYTDGAPAEFGQFSGMLVNVVTKDGGDEHHGSAAVFYTQHAFLQPTYDIYDPETIREEATLKARNRSPAINLTAGGPLLREKVWYFAALDGSTSWSVAEGLTDDRATTRRDGQFLGKLTWFPTAHVALRYTFTQALAAADRVDSGLLVSPEATSDRRSSTRSQLLTLTWSPPSGRSHLVVRAGWTDVELDMLPTSRDRETASRLDIGNVLRGNAIQFDFNDRRRAGGSFAFRHAVDGFLGDHEFKVGADFWRLEEMHEVVNTGASDMEWILIDGTPTGTTTNLGTKYSADPDAGYPCNQPDGSDCGLVEHWTNVGAVGNTVYTYSAFLQDDWTPAPRLHLHLGARMDAEDGRSHEGNRPAAQNPADFQVPRSERETVALGPLWMFAPRLGLSWDVTGDSKTRLYAHTGRYYDLVGNNFWRWSNSRSPRGFLRYTRDASGGWQHAHTQDPEGNPLNYASGLRYARMDKAVLGFEREVLPLLSLGVRGLLSKTEGLSEDINLDVDEWFIMNSSVKERNYRGLEFTVEKKHDGIWQLLASYTLSESYGHMPGGWEGSATETGRSDGNNVGVYLDDISEEAARAELYENGEATYLEGWKGLGRCSVTDPDYCDDAGHFGYLPGHAFHMVKVNGSVRAPWGTQFAMVYEFDSGRAWQKRGNIPFYGNLSFPQGRGSRFTPPVHYVDVRFAHRFDLRKERSVELTLDVFNLPGFATAITYYDVDRPGFGMTMHRQAPRSVRGGLKYRW